ncbi:MULTISPECIES: TlpA family protein disulfide reductase [unclassified Arsukibacterium]|uniref:TlpA family protein disulfide reductase n=1 Tax=unclassified Arsukibacterium TaxID=2635278 RepID=UPI000C3BFA65|nr:MULTISPECIES: TlpA disulfide reductase family protein [unclassified Arsukibacterium]MBM34194.1 redoxin [Rheinheimera sp.]HAW92195.1 redoxin [Candidatus Azambacteria bacterium]
MLTSVNLGPLALPLPPLLLLISVLLGLLVAALVGRKYKVSVTDPLLTIFLGSFLLGRLAFVARFADSYDTVWQMLDIRDRGFDVAATLVGAVTILLWLLWHRRQQRQALLAGVLTVTMLFGAFSSVIYVGRQQAVLPELTLQQLNGDSVNLADLGRGQLTVVNLWASWCPPCRREMPVLQQAEQLYSEVRFVLLNQREHPQTVQQYLNQAGLTFNHLLLDRQGQFASQLGAHGLPVTLYFGADGQLLHSHMGELSAASLAHSLQQFGVSAE